jgi:hypothetical protein
MDYNYRELVRRYYKMRTYAQKMLNEADDLQTSYCSEYHSGNCNCAAESKAWFDEFAALIKDEPGELRASVNVLISPPGLAAKSAYCDKNGIQIRFTSNVTDGELEVILSGTEEALVGYLQEFDGDDWAEALERLYLDEKGAV